MPAKENLETDEKAEGQGQNADAEEISILPVNVASYDKLRGKQNHFSGPRKPSIMRSIISTLYVDFKYTLDDVRNRPRNTIIGFVAVFLLVFFSGLVLVSLWKTPYVVLRLAELNAGEADFSFVPSEDGGGWLNFSEVAKKIESSEQLKGAVPRWLAKAELDANPRLPFFDLFDPEFFYANNENSNTSMNAAGPPRTTSYVLITDTEREQKVGIGRNWKQRPTGYGEVSLYYAAAEYLGVQSQRGERVSFTLDIGSLGAASSVITSNASTIAVPPAVLVSNDLVSSYIRNFLEVNNLPKDRVSIFDLMSASFSAVVVDVFEGPNGKYPSAFGNVAIMDYKQILSLLLEESCAAGGEFGPKASLRYPPWNPNNESSDLNDTVVTSFKFMRSLQQSIKNFNLVEHAMGILFVLQDRYNIYYEEASVRKQRMIAATNKVMLDIGLDFDTSIDYTLTTTFNELDLFKVLILTSFATIVVAMIALGSILLFTLLRINSKERQYEVAMMRAQGMPKSQIGSLLFSEAVVFSVPATFIGILFVFFCNLILEALLTKFTSAPARYNTFPIFVLLFCVAAGFVLPLVALWPSVRRALSTSLRDALDIYREEVNATTVKMIKLAQLGLEWWEMVVGGFLVLAGFVVYYLIPLSFVFQNFMMFFFQLDIILACMVVGLCLVFSVIKNYIQKGLIWLMLWGPERRLMMVVEKNSESHKENNSSAFMMFLLSVASLVAGGLMFSVLASLSTQLSELVSGAEISITSVSIAAPLHVEQLDWFLKTVGAAYVYTWAYSSFSLQSYTSVGRTKVQNAAGNSYNIPVIGITENFMSATYDSYNIIEELNTNYVYEDVFGKEDVVKSMFDDKPPSSLEDASVFITGRLPEVPLPPSESPEQQKRPVIPVLISSNAKNALGANVFTNLKLSYTYKLQDKKSKNENVMITMSSEFMLESRALMVRVAGFPLISPLTFRAGAILVTADAFHTLLNSLEYDLSEKDKRYYVLPQANSNSPLYEGTGESKRRKVVQKVLYIRLKPEITQKERENFVNLLQPYTDVNYHVTVDTVALVNDLNRIRDAIMYFFYFTAVICTTLCAFMIWITFIANVQLQLWSFGVLRSLGFRNAQLIRACVYESLSIVLSAFVGGTTVGSVVGLSVARQLSTFMSLPYRVNFPYVLVLIIFVLCLAAAVIGSSIPLLVSRRRSISSIIKGI